MNFVYDSFYIQQKKYIPTKYPVSRIGTFLTEQALPLWVIEKGRESRSGMKISTQRFFYTENLLLQKTLSNKFSVKPAIEHDKG